MRVKLPRAAFLLAVLAISARGADKAPQWLTEIATRELPKYDSDVPAAVLFHEQLVTVSTEGTVTTSVRKAVKILARSGREEASGSVVYRTDTGKVQSLRGWTIYASGDGRSYGKKEIADVSLAENDIYNESRLKFISGSSDVDPGSVFGYESVKQDRSIFTQFSFAFQDDLPALTSRFTLKLPAGWTAKSVTHNHAEIEPLVQGSSYTWQLQHLPPIGDEPARPPISAIAPRVNVSYYPPPSVGNAGPTFEDWGQVSAWLASLNDPRSLPDDSIASKARSLVEGKSSELERISAIAKYAQEINYVSIQIGVGRGGGYQPHSAAEVFQKAYGDCKDKANLMRAMLKSVGVESYPVAIYSSDRDYVRKDWASPHQFNHAILAVKVSSETEAPAIADYENLGRLLFFDPTDTYTTPGSLPESLQSSLALVVRGEGGELVRAPAATAEENLLKREIKVTLEADGSITAQIREHSKGSSAATNRRHFESRARADYRKFIERWVSRGVPGASIGDIAAGDRDDGDFFVDVNFTAARYGKRMGGRLLIFKPAVVSRRNFTHLRDIERKYAVRLGANTYSEDVEIDLPAGFTVDEMSEPVDLTTDFGTYHAEWRVEDGKLYFQRQMQFSNATVPPEDYALVKDFFDQMIAAEQAPVVLMKQ